MPADGGPSLVRALQTASKRSGHPPQHPGHLVAVLDCVARGLEELIWARKPAPRVYKACKQSPAFADNMRIKLRPRANSGRTAGGSFRRRRAPDRYFKNLEAVRLQPASRRTQGPCNPPSCPLAGTSANACACDRAVACCRTLAGVARRTGPWAVRHSQLLPRAPLPPPLLLLLQLPKAAPCAPPKMLAVLFREGFTCRPRAALEAATAAVHACA